jgi:hypothetical protein
MVPILLPAAHGGNRPSATEEINELAAACDAPAAAIFPNHD